MASSLEKLTVAELDGLADELGLADYPADALKADKVAALAAAGAGEETEEDLVYKLRLRDELDGETLNSAQFMVLGEAVELTSDAPEYSTSDASVFAGLRDLPFLEVVE